MSKDKKCHIELSVDNKGNLTKSNFGGNVGSMFSAVGSLLAYLITEHCLDPDTVLDTLKTSVLTSIEIVNKKD